MNVKELKALAKERGIKRYYRLRKAELIESLDTETPPTDAPTTIMDAPATEIMDEPVPEIKKPVLSPTKMENISRVSSLVGLAKKQADLVNKAIKKFADWLINYIPEPIPRTVNTRVEKLKKEIKEILENKKKLPQQEVNTTGESSAPQEVFTNKTEIKLVENGGRVKVYKTTGNLNFDLTDKIMEKITPIIETRTKVIQAFSCVIYRGQGEIIEYSKTFKAPPGTFSSLDDIKEYIRQCEQKRLDLEDFETWSKAYLPATATYASKGRVLFTSVSTKIILSNEPLFGCGQLPKWLADKKCIYAIDKINDNLCLWRCLVIHQRIMKGKKRPEEKTNRDALNLAREFYRIPILRRVDVKPTRLVDFENIAKQFKVNIRLFEPVKESKTVWKLVFGKNQFRKNLPCVDIGLFVYEDHDEKQADIPVDGYEPESKTIFQYYGCKWHGCPCQKERNSLEEERYAKTIELEKKMKEKHLKIVSVWECEKPELKKMRFKKEFRPYPYFIVYDFEALCKKIHESQTEELTITAKHIPVSVAVNDNFTKKPSFIVDEDPKNLVKRFVENVLERISKIAEEVNSLYPCPGIREESDEEGNEEIVRLPKKSLENLGRTSSCFWF